MGNTEDAAVEQVGILTDAVRGFLSRQGDIIGQLNSELADLRSDDSVDDAKLEGVSGVVQSLIEEINSFGQTTEVPVDPAEPGGMTEPLTEDPVIPEGEGGALA